MDASIDIGQGELQRSLGRIEGKLDLIQTNISAHILDDKSAFNAIENRISSVERKIWVFTGAITLVATLTGYFVNRLHIF